MKKFLVLFLLMGALISARSEKIAVSTEDTKKVEVVSKEAEAPIPSDIKKFDYLKFDVSKFIDKNEKIELPDNTKKIDYLKFDVKKYSTDSIVELPELE